ncbi:PqqD family protein [Phocaeicola sp.]
MKISPNFKLRAIAGETIIVNQGTPDADLTRIISLNASARLLWEELSGKDFTLDDAAKILETRYGIFREQARKDVFVWAENLQKCGILMGE